MKTQPDSYISGEGDTVIPYDHVIEVPIVVLCDEYTASAGEIFTAALRDYADEGIVNVTIVGTNTYGKGIMQTTFVNFAVGDALKLTTAKIYWPKSNITIHGVGISKNLSAFASKIYEAPYQENIDYELAYAISLQPQLI